MTRAEEVLATALLIDEVRALSVAPGISRRDLPSTDFAAAWVIDFEPGSVWPEVDYHETEERYFVLAGEVIEGEARHGPGTYVVLPAGSCHRPRSDVGARIIGLNQV